MPQRPIPELPAYLDGAVVVGGGIVGCAVAYELAKANCHCLLLERRQIGSGVTGASLAALTSHALHDINDLPYVMAASKRWAELESEFGVPFEYERTGQIRLITTEEERQSFEARVAVHRAAGARLELLDSHGLRSVLDCIGEHAAVGAIFSRDDAKVNALKAVRALGQSAVRLGAKVITGSEVIEVAPAVGGGLRVATRNGAVVARWVVVCAGPWTRALLAPLGVDLAIRSRVAQCAVTEQVGTLFDPIVSGSDTGVGLGPGFFQMQQTKSGHVLFNTVVESPRVQLRDPDRVPADYHFLVRSTRTLAKVFPPCRDVRILRAWAALEAWTPDRRFLLGAIPDMPGLVVAAGDSGRGFLSAPLLGQFVAALIAGGTAPELDVARFDPARFD